MKAGYAAKQWLNRLRLRSTPPSSTTQPSGERNVSMGPLQEAMRLVKSGDLTGATAVIQQNLQRLGKALGGAPAAPIEDGYEVLDAGTFSDFERPALDNPAAAQQIPGMGAQFQEASYTNPAGSRRYKLFIPAAYCGQSMPLLVMLHGCKQSPDDFALGTRMNILAEKQRCFIAYPAQAQAANRSKCWNWFDAFDQRRGYGEPAIIAGLTRELVKKYGLDARRVYVAGLSAGGAMAVVMGRTYPDLYAAVGVHSGLPYAAAHDVASAFAAMNGRAPVRGSASTPAVLIMPTIVLHGDRDKTVHPGNGERVAAESVSHFALPLDGKSMAAASGIEEQKGRVPGGYPYTRKLFRNENGDVVVEQWLVHGAGHAWFGGNPRGSFTDPKGPDASKEMLRFFSAHTLDRKQYPQPG